MNKDLEIKIYSQNVRGIANSVKRRCIFSWLRNQPYDIFMLQETHSDRNCESIWSSEWGYKIFFSHGTSSKAGVCILLKPRSAIAVQSVYRDKEGRMILLNVMHGESVFSVANVYGPNIDNGTFFKVYMI